MIFDESGDSCKSGYSVEFSDEDTDPSIFKDDSLIVFIDLDEKVFASVGLVSELKRRKLKVIGLMDKIKNKEYKIEIMNFAPQFLLHLFVHPC